jgi:Mannosyl-glycoprotein endo-beta-N-acetylglucosaminidase
MPKAYRRRSHRSTIRGRNFRIKFKFTHFGVIVVIAGILITWWLKTTTDAAFQSTQYSLVGQPTISANFINQVLDHYHSPAAGKGQALYDDGVTYGIDPVYALAFFMYESSFGTTGVARVTHSLGNIRVTEGYRGYEGYRWYKTWEDGFKDWYVLISDQYVRRWNLTTVDQIVPMYAPSSDNNDVQAYIASVKRAVDTWRSGNVEI